MIPDGHCEMLAKRKQMSDCPALVTSGYQAVRAYLIETCFNSG